KIATMASVGSSTSFSGSRISIGGVVVVESGGVTVVEVVVDGTLVFVLVAVSTATVVDEAVVEHAPSTSIGTRSRPHHPWIRIHYLSLAND
ncbi:MAG: hypothetical protein ACN4GK_02110, partial [Acidimicrobiia bacterium]